MIEQKQVRLPAYRQIPHTAANGGASEPGKLAMSSGHTPELPHNIQMLLLPPYSPELNVTGHIGDCIREKKGINNHVFTVIDQVADKLPKALKQVNDEKDIIETMCNFNWLHTASY